MSRGLPERRPYSPVRRLVVLARAAARRVVVDGDVDRVRLGRLLVAAQVVFALVVSPLLGLTDRAFTALLAVSTAMVAVLVVSYAVPWRRLPATAACVFGAVVMAGLLGLGAVQPLVFTPLLSFTTLSFVYLGVTQPARVAAFLAPLAAVTLIANYGALDGPVVIRVLIATAVWLTTASALAALTAHSTASSHALRHAASIDALTGIPNRRHLDVRLDTLEGDETIIVVDLDHFKQINDTLGHAAGDAVLAQFGSMLREELRTVDYCARLGGEEFVLVLPPMSDPHAHHVVIARLRARWARIAPGITFSTGAAHSHPDRPSTTTLQLADHALYLAKNAGRNTDRDAEPTTTIDA